MPEHKPVARWGAKLAFGMIVTAGLIPVTGCISISALTASLDPRSEKDIDGDGVDNAADGDTDGDGLVNAVDPDADSDGRFDRPMIIDFPFDHNAFIKPLLPPNHPDIDFSGRVIMPNGHIDVTDIIRANFPNHPMEVFEPVRQAEIAAQPPPEE